jgi:hypothetical protein
MAHANKQRNSRPRPMNSFPSLQLVQQKSATPATRQGIGTAPVWQPYKYIKIQVQDQHPFRVLIPLSSQLFYCNFRIVLSAAPRLTGRLPVAEEVFPDQRSVTE